MGYLITILAFPVFIKIPFAVILTGGFALGGLLLYLFLLLVIIACLYSIWFSRALILVVTCYSIVSIVKVVLNSVNFNTAEAIITYFTNIALLPLYGVLLFIVMIMKYLLRNDSVVAANYKTE